MLFKIVAHHMLRFFSISIVDFFSGDYLLVNKNKMLWVFLCWKGNKKSPNSFPSLATHTPSQLSPVHTGRHNKQTITCWKTHLKTKRSHYPRVLGNINLVFGKQLTVEGWGFSLFYSRTKKGWGWGRESHLRIKGKRSSLWPLTEINALRDHQLPTQI